MDIDAWPFIRYRFSLVDPDRRDAEPNEQTGMVLTFANYFKQNPNIKIPEITVAEIEDQSKGDVLFKLIAIIQCILRVASNNWHSLN